MKELGKSTTTIWATDGIAKTRTKYFTNRSALTFANLLGLLIARRLGKIHAISQLVTLPSDLTLATFCAS
jgi:hypothetical protein